MQEEEAIRITLEQLYEQAEDNPGKHDIQNAIGECEVNGVKYQMQVCLIANPKLWLAENEVRFTEVVKIHE